MTDIDVALQALRSDAQLWSTAASELEAPKGAVGGLALGGAEMSMYAVDLGLDQTYNNARARIIDLLGQGQQNFNNLSQALTAAADTYQREEEANLHLIEGTY